MKNKILKTLLSLIMLLWRKNIPLYINSIVKSHMMIFFVFLKIFFILWIFFFPPNSFSQTKPALQVFDSTKVCDGYILWMDLESCSHLIDRQCKVLFNFPGSLGTFFNKKKALVSSVGGSLAAYNKNYDQLWKVKIKTQIHHDITITPDDNILLLSFENKAINSDSIRFDNILCFNSKGKELYKWSTYDQRRYLMSFMMKDPGIYYYRIAGSSDPDSVFLQIAPTFTKGGNLLPEFFHMNAIQVIPENESEKEDSIFRKGNILLSFCNYNANLSSFLAIVDPVNYEILWHYVQKNRRPIHSPTMLPNGHILVYVNSVSDIDSSFIEEIDPIKKKVVWNYVEKFPDVIGRVERGSCQRLPNGNTLISNANGYIYEVTPQKQIIWQYFTNNTYHVYRAYWYPKEKLKWLVNEE